MPVQEIPKHLQDLRATVRSGRTRPMAWRKKQLKRLRALVKENAGVLAAALREDLGKSDFEAWSAETNFTLNEIDHSLSHMDEWARPEPVKRQSLLFCNVSTTSRVGKSPLMATTSATSISNLSFDKSRSYHRNRSCFPNPSRKISNTQARVRRTTKSKSLLGS